MARRRNPLPTTPITYVSNGTEYVPVFDMHIANASGNFVRVREAYVANALGVWRKVHPPAPWYQLIATPTNTNEGTSITFTLNTAYVLDGTLVPYTISGTGITAADITSIAGNFTVNNDTASVTISVSADMLTEGIEYLTMYAGNTQVTASINDTSITPPVGSSSFATVGTFTFTVPANVNTIKVYVVGGGGAGAWSGGGGGGIPGGGGGGGGYAYKLIPVTPGQQFTLTVGNGGAAGSWFWQSGQAGGTSSFSTISASGGSGGVTNAGYAPGGTASGGDINITGGTASPLYNGGTGGTAGGTLPYGGGVGGAGGGYPQTGQQPGGGGGGSHATGNGVNYGGNGAPGGKGLVTITWGM